MTITGIRPIFIVDDNIIRIERSRIFVIQGNVDKMPETFKKFLAKISEEDKIPVEYSTGENQNTASYSDRSSCHFLNEVMD